MNQAKIILLYIFSFGIAYFVLRAKAKKKAQTFNKELTLSTKLPFKLNDFLNVFGGIDNIQSLSSTINTIKIQLIDKTKFSADNLKVIKVKGIMWGANNVATIILGDFAIELEKQIRSIMNLK